MAGPKMDETARFERRERENALSNVVRNRLASGSWGDPDADLPVLELEQSVRSMSEFIRRMLCGTYRAYGRKLHADLFTGELDELGRGQVYDLFEQRRLLKTLGRALKYDSLVIEANLALLANPLSIDAIDGLGFSHLIRDLLWDESHGETELADIESMREYVLAWTGREPVDAQFALDVLARARRDRRRSDAAAASTPGAHRRVPLVRPGNLNDSYDEERYQRNFAYAIPTEAALRAVAMQGPIVQVEALGGYWAALLRDRGADVLAFDPHPHPEKDASHPIDRSWGQVAEAPSTIAAQYADRALLMIRPPHEEPMALLQALQSYGGTRLAYIGGTGNGEGADDSFFRLLDEAWDRVQEVCIPQWGGMHNCLTVYRRR